MSSLRVKQASYSVVKTDISVYILSQLENNRRDSGWFSFFKDNNNDKSLETVLETNTAFASC